MLPYTLSSGFGYGGGGDGEGLPSVSKPGEVPNSFPQRILLSSLLELTGGSREWGVGRLRRKNSASSSSGQNCKIVTSKLARCLGALVGNICCVGSSAGYARGPCEAGRLRHNLRVSANKHR